MEVVIFFGLYRMPTVLIYKGYPPSGVKNDKNFENFDMCPEDQKGVFSCVEHESDV